MSTNIVPRTFESLVQLAVKAAAGAQLLGEAIGLAHHTHARITADLFDLTGNPTRPEIPGQQAMLNSQKLATRSGYEASRAAVAAGQEFCRLGIALLKRVLGTSYNSAWHEAGFLARTLRVPRKPVAMLIEFRQYLDLNPSQANAAAGFTAARAQEILEMLQSANLAIAPGARIAAKRARDHALRKLKKCMSGLRAELEYLLSPDDGRWQEFGFRVPAAGRIPEKVENVEVTPSVAGSIVVAWTPARLAKKYRVTWRPNNSAPDSETEVGLFADEQTWISGLPIGVQIVIGVSARNRSGESRVTEATVSIPN
jgi:hypothetical protein